MTETVLIMGAGAVAGVGGALAQKFAARGFHVIVAGRTQSKLDGIVESVISGGGSAEAVVANVTVDKIRIRFLIALTCAVNLWRPLCITPVATYRSSFRT